MLILNLNPQEDAQRKGPLSAEWSAPVLTLNGSPYDLSLLEDGATATHSVLGTVTHNGDDYSVSITLLYRHGAPRATTFPEPITVTEDGPIQLPPYDAPQPAPEADDDLAD